MNGDHAGKLGDLVFDTDIAKFLPKQQAAVDALDEGIKFLLYGGALGGGKSRFLRWFAIRHLISLHVMGLDNVTVMLACEDYPSLKDRQLQKIALEFPPWLGKNYTDHKDYGRCFILHETYGSGVICFRNLDDPSKYASAEFAAILVDELTKNDYETFNFLRTRLRWPGLEDQDCKFIGATNPGGPGHGWVKQLWLDQDLPKEFIEPIDYRPVFRFIPSRADDNPYLDGSYWNMLHTLPERMRKAFKDGDWEIFVGQVFTEWRQSYHIIDPVMPQAGQPVTMTFDWGFGAPFSLGWWMEDYEGRIIRFQEWYGWNGNPNQGLRYSDSEIAEGIKAREKAWELEGRNPIDRLAGPDCFQKKPDYRGGGQGPSTADVFREFYGLHLRPGDPDRKLKVKQFHERLRIREDDKPMMMVCSNCKHFIRTIPSLVQDENNIEDIDTDSEDHVYDEACHMVMEKMPKSRRRYGLDPESMLA
jgi:hypothetical protein